MNDSLAETLVNRVADIVDQLRHIHETLEQIETNMQK